MHGFIAIINRNVSTIPVSWKKPFSFQEEYTLRKLNGSGFYIEQYTSLHFLKEKHWIDTPNFLFISEGIILNASLLMKKYRVTDMALLVSLMYTQDTAFFREFEGNFTGLFYDKNKDEWFFFNNQTGAKKLYYFKDKEYTVVSTDLYTLKQSLDFLHISTQTDIEAAYLLLTSGFMHGNKTLIQEVKQVRAGEYIHLQDNRLSSGFYFHLNQIEPTSDSKRDIIHTLDSLFREAVELEFNVQKEEHLQHITTISGGLDSRMTLLTAWKSGYRQQHPLCFSEKGYADEIIAREITKAYDLPLKYIPLSGEGLKHIDDVISVNDGQTIYTGSSHVFQAFRQLKQTAGLVHTGMIGDAVMGSFISSPSGSPSIKISSGVYSQSLLPKAEKIIKASQNNYEDEETYKFYNRAFLGANNGFLYYDLIGESFSPFLNTKFLSYAFSMPRQYKYKESLYIDWIRTLHPDIARFTWESIGGKPTNNKIIRTCYRYKRAFIKRLPVKTMWKNNMNPEQVWYDSDKEIRNVLDNYFNTYINLIQDKELKQDAISLYRDGDITEKTQVITLLGGIKLLFNN